MGIFSIFKKQDKEVRSLENVTRLEIIGKETEYVKYNIDSIDLDVQDNGRTLKIFTNEKESKVKGIDDIQMENLGKQLIECFKI